MDGFYPHPLRHTLAVELLQADTAIQDVSKMPNHSSGPVTENHSAKDRSRRNRLERVLLRAD